MTIKMFNAQSVTKRDRLFRIWDPLSYLAAEVEHLMEQLDSTAAAEGYEVDWFGSLAFSVRYDGLADGVLLTVRAKGEQPQPA